jgi:hypothetical protein
MDKSGGYTSCGEELIDLPADNTISPQETTAPQSMIRMTGAYSSGHCLNLYSTGSMNEDIV